MSERLTLDSETCPYCAADLRGIEIPVNDRQHYGGKTNYSRVIGLYSREADRTVAVRCPDCGKEDAR